MRLPLVFLVLALVSIGLWGSALLLGWGAEVGVLTGQVVDPGAATRGLLYVAAWLQVVVVAPILLLAAGITAVLHRVGAWQVDRPRGSGRR